jgi:MFS family permease
MTRQWAVLAEHGDFRRLFAASSVSLLGSSVTTVALPLTAVVYLNASPAQMGVLGAAGFLPHLVLGLPAGVWVNRWPYRRLLVSADLMQMLLLGVVPVLAVLAVLRIWELYVVVVLAGVCALFDAVAAQSLTPMLVPRPRLLAANSVLALSNSTVSTTGAALGGALVQALTAPVAIAVDAASFLFSAVCKTRIGAGDAGETSPMRTDRPRQHLLQQILDGLRAVFGDPVVRAATVSATLGALAGQMQAVVVVLFLVRTLHLSSALVGVVIAVAGAAGILGAAVGVPITERIGHGPAFIMGMLLASAAGLIMAAANGSFAVVLVVLIVAQTLRGCGPSLYGLNQQTIRQAFIPRELMSRAQATWRFLVYGTQPIGALLGGLLASTAGLRATLITSSIGMLAATIVALASQLRKLRTLPEKAVRPSR